MKRHLTVGLQDRKRLELKSHQRKRQSQLNPRLNRRLCNLRRMFSSQVRVRLVVTPSYFLITRTTSEAVSFSHHSTRTVTTDFIQHIRSCLFTLVVRVIKVV